MVASSMKCDGVIVESSHQTRSIHVDERGNDGPHGEEASEVLAQEYS